MLRKYRQSNNVIFFFLFHIGKTEYTINLPIEDKEEKKNEENDIELKFDSNYKYYLYSHITINFWSIQNIHFKILIRKIINILNKIFF